MSFPIIGYAGGQAFPGENLLLVVAALIAMRPFVWLGCWLLARFVLKDGEQVLER